MAGGCGWGCGSLPADGPGRPERVARAAPAFGARTEARGEAGRREAEASRSRDGRRGASARRVWAGAGGPAPPPPPPRAPRPPRTRRARGGGRRARRAGGSPRRPRSPRPCQPTRWCRFAWRDRCYPVSKQAHRAGDYFRALYRSGMQGQVQAGGPECSSCAASSARACAWCWTSSARAAPGSWLLGRRGSRAGAEEEEDADGDLLSGRLVEAASFLQVTSLLQLLLSQVPLTTAWSCTAWHPGVRAPHYQEACLRFMAVTSTGAASPVPPPGRFSSMAPGDVSLKQRLKRRMTPLPSSWPWGTSWGTPGPSPLPRGAPVHARKSRR